MENLALDVIESYEHLDPSFLLRGYHVNHMGEDEFFFKAHRHKEMQIVWVVSGVLEITVVQHTFFATAGDIVIIPPKLTHSIKPLDFKKATFNTIIFNLDLLASRTPDVIQSTYISPLLKNHHEYLYYIHHRQESNPHFRCYLDALLHVYFTKEAGFELEIKAYLFLLIKNLLTYKDSLTALEVDVREAIFNYKTQEELCKKITAYIQHNLHRKLSLDEIAGYVGFERSYFSRFFKKNFNTSFSTYLVETRIKQASHLLKHSSKTITEIAYESGFSDPNYFSLVFKKVTQQTPREYRENKKAIAT